MLAGSADRNDAAAWGAVFAGGFASATRLSSGSLSSSGGTFCLLSAALFTGGRLGEVLEAAAAAWFPPELEGVDAGVGAADFS
jgi:hypothetical protein